VLESCLIERENDAILGNIRWKITVSHLLLGDILKLNVLKQKIIGGWLSLILGPKLVLGVSIFMGSIFTLFSPMAAHFDYKMLMVLRLFIGFSQVKIF
jgi:hypothetical protein